MQTDLFFIDVEDWTGFGHNRGTERQIYEGNQTEAEDHILGLVQGDAAPLNITIFSTRLENGVRVEHETVYNWNKSDAEDKIRTDKLNLALSKMKEDETLDDCFIPTEFSPSLEILRGVCDRHNIPMTGFHDMDLEQIREATTSEFMDDLANSLESLEWDISDDVYEEMAEALYGITFSEVYDRIQCDGPDM